MQPAGPRMGAVGMPVAKTANFNASMRRLLSMLRQERVGFVAVVVLALVSVTCTVLGPRALGHATDILFQGLIAGGPQKIDFGDLHRVLLGVLAAAVGALYLAQGVS